jgi:hypothetical protein
MPYPCKTRRQPALDKDHEIRFEDQALRVSADRGARQTGLLCSLPDELPTRAVLLPKLSMYVAAIACFVPGDQDDSNRASEAQVATFHIGITNCSN